MGKKKFSPSESMDFRIGGGGQFAMDRFIKKIKKKYPKPWIFIIKRVFWSLKREKSIKNILEVLQRLLDVEKALQRRTWWTWGGGELINQHLGFKWVTKSWSNNIVQHISRKLLSSRIQQSHPYASQHIKGVLESVVNCIPWRWNIGWGTK